MKKFTLLFTALLLISAITYAQRFAYVDTEYILEKMPEYTQAQEQLDKLSAQWQQEIETKYDEVEEMYKKYQAEQVLLTAEMKQKREQQIMDKEKEVKEFQKKKFGYEGELFQERQELIKPIQDKVYDQIQKIAESKGYDFVFDKSSGLTMLYTNTRYDLSEEVLRAMGYSAATQEK